MKNRLCFATFTKIVRHQLNYMCTSLHFLNNVLLDNACTHNTDNISIHTHPVNYNNIYLKPNI